MGPWKETGMGGGGLSITPGGRASTDVNAAGGNRVIPYSAATTGKRASVTHRSAGGAICGNGFAVASGGRALARGSIAKKVPCKFAAIYSISRVNLNE